MKTRITTLAIALALPLLIMAQPGKKPAAKEKPPSQSDMNKVMQDAMKDMSPEDQATMKKMMGGAMENMAKKPGSDVVTFTDNKKLVPSKDIGRIKNIPAKAFTDADIIANAALLYSKLMAKIPAAEKTLINRIQASAKDGPSLMSASITAMLQGHNQAAMGLAMKAVQADPKNVNYQNNLAAILSQSGYPEHAIPYLQKLSRQFPGNSTVLNNLGYAWLNLGQIDTARRLFAYAAMRNPNNPETKLCRGVIAELTGDPKKAADNYVESFEQAPNPFTESLVKNAKAQDRLEKIDFDKLKKRIVIYEYFKKDWIKIPVLSDEVLGFENDMRIKNGYSNMFGELRAKIESMAEASNAEVAALAEKGMPEFAAAMQQESMKGLSMMSMPAVYVQKILQSHIVKWTEDYVREQQAMLDMISAKRKEMTKAGANDKCPDFDRKNNEFLAYVNPRVRSFYAKKIEESRTWLNAFCTWSWYIAGNPKNVVRTQCITWTASIVALLESAVADQQTFAKSCVQQDSDGAELIRAPIIPNFSCPAVVTFPVGLDEIRLSAEAINFDNNSWNIAQAPGAAVPNLTMTFGVGKSDIAEPGKYGNPYTKTGNGSITASGIGTPGGNDDDLTPLTKIPMDELAPLDPQLLNTNKKLTVTDANKINRAKLARQILKEMMSVKCPGELPKKSIRKPKFYVGIGELELEEPLIVGLGELELWDEEMKAWVNSKGEYRFENGLTVSIGELVLEEVETSGLQTVINNGLQMLNTAKDFIKGLFD